MSIMLNNKKNKSATKKNVGCCAVQDSSEADNTMNQNVSRSEKQHQWVLPVIGMHCGACASKVEKALNSVSGTISVHVDLDKESAIVVGDPSLIEEKALQEAIHRAGYSTTADPISPTSRRSAHQVNLVPSLAFGAVAASAVIGFYLGLITLTSDWFNARAQFADYRGWILALAVGLGLQAGLFSHMRRVLAGIRIKKGAAGMAASGSMSGVAMALCCSHYLAAILPAIGLPFLSGMIAGLVEYQALFFILGVVSNLLGLANMIRLMLKNGIIHIPSQIGDIAFAVSKKE